MSGDHLHQALSSLFTLAREDLKVLLEKQNPRGSGTLHHLIDGDEMAKFAQDRLGQLADEHAPPWFDGSLLSLNCGNQERMFGYLDGEQRLFMPLWWDVGHRVCGHRP